MHENARVNVRYMQCCAVVVLCVPMCGVFTFSQRVNFFARTLDRMRVAAKEGSPRDAGFESLQFSEEITSLWDGEVLPLIVLRELSGFLECCKRGTHRLLTGLVTLDAECLDDLTTSEAVVTRGNDLNHFRPLPSTSAA